MATVRIISKGNPIDGSEIDNIASEETLLAMLEQMHLIKDSILKNNKQSVIPSKSTSPEEEKSRKEIAETTETTSKLKDKLKDVSNAITKDILPELSDLSVLTSVINVTKQAFFGVTNTAGLLVNAFLNGKTTFADYMDIIDKGLSGIPIIGTLFSIFAAGVRIVDTWNNTLYDLNTVGASFHGSLVQMRMSAAFAGMSLEEYAKIIKNNAALLAQFGTVMQGVSIYTHIANIAMNENVNQLTSMGISLDQYQRELPGVLTLFGASMKAHGASDRVLASSALELTEQFNAMAKITGQTREQQAANLQKLITDAAWTLRMSELKGNAGERELAALTEINAIMGPTAAELYKMHILGIVPLSRDMQLLQATMPGLSDTFNKVDNAARAGLDNKTFSKQLDSSIALMAEQAYRSGKGLEEILKAASAHIGGTPEEISKVYTELLNNSRDYISKDGQFQISKFKQNLDNARKEKDAQEQVRKSLADFNKQMEQLQMYFYEHMLIPMMNVIGPIIDGVVKEFETKNSALRGVIDELVIMVKAIGVWVSDNMGTIMEWVAAGLTLTMYIIAFVAEFVTFVVKHSAVVKGILITLAVIGAAILAFSAGLAISLLFYTGATTTASIAINGFTLATTLASASLIPMAAFVGLVILALTSLIVFIATFIPSVKKMLDNIHLPKMPDLVSLQKQFNAPQVVNAQPTLNNKNVTLINNATPANMKVSTMPDLYKLIAQQSSPQSTNNTGLPSTNENNLFSNATGKTEKNTYDKLGDKMDNQSRLLRQIRDLMSQLTVSSKRQLGIAAANQ